MLRLIAALGCVLVLPAAGEAQFEQGPLTEAERGRLEAGETVIRERHERRGPLRLIGGSSFQLIDTPPGDSWASVNEVSSEYRHMLPQVHRSREVSRSGNVRVIEFVHRVGPVSVEYSLRFTFDPEAHTLLFQLDETRPHDIRAAWGYLRIRGYEGNRTLVSFGTLVDVGDSGVISGLMQPTIHEWIMKIPWTVKRYVNGRGRTRRNHH